MVGCVGNAPTLVFAGHPLYRRLAIFTRLPTQWWTAEEAEGNSGGWWAGE